MFWLNLNLKWQELMKKEAWSTWEHTKFFLEFFSFLTQLIMSTLGFKYKRKFTNQNQCSSVPSFFIHNFFFFKIWKCNAFCRLFSMEMKIKEIIFFFNQWPSILKAFLFEQKSFDLNEFYRKNWIWIFMVFPFTKLKFYLPNFLFVGYLFIF